MGGDPKPAAGHEFVVNRDPDVATAWAKHRAIVSYENFHGINVDLKSDHIVTDIQKIANSALWIDGWALHDVGFLEDAGDAGRGAVPLRSISW